MPTPINKLSTNKAFHAVVVLDTQHRVVSYNIESQMLFAHFYDAVLSPGLAVDTYIVNQQNYFPHFEKALNGSSQSFERNMEYLAGQEMWMTLTYTPLFKDGKVEHILFSAINTTERKKYESLLLDSQANLNAIFDSTDKVYVFVDAQMRIMRYNKRAIPFFGDVFGGRIERLKTFSACLEPWQSKDFEALIGTSLQGETSTLEKCYATHKTHSDKWFEMRCQPVHGGNHEQEGVLLELSEITARKTAEEELNKSRQKFMQFAELLPQTAFEINGNGQILFINKQGGQTFGINQQRLDNSPIYLHQFITEDQYHNFYRTLAKCWEGEPIKSHEFCFKKNGGGEFLGHLYLNFVSNNKNKPLVASGIIIDISEIRRTENALREREESYRQLADNMQEAIFRYSFITQKYEYVNPSIETLTGHSPQTFYANSKIFNRIVHPDWLNYYQKYLNTISQGEINHTLEFQIITQAGETKWVSQKNTVKTNKQGEVLAMESLLTDVTYHRDFEAVLIQSEQELRDLNNTKDQLLSIIAHDLKNPFNNLLGLAYLAIKNIEEQNTDKVLQYLRLIHGSATAGYGLLENLLKWSRIQSGKITFSPRTIDLHQMVLEAVTFMDIIAQEKNIKIINEVPIASFVMADPNLLSTIVRNLVSNALKFTPEKGEVQIQAQFSYSEFSILVIDTGIGITTEKLREIFDSNDIKSTLGTNQEQGSGLGLKLCKEFSHLHKGRIRVSSNVGKGSTFTVTIPFAV